MDGWMPFLSVCVCVISARLNVTKTVGAPQRITYFSILWSTYLDGVFLYLTH